MSLARQLGIGFSRVLMNILRPTRLLSTCLKPRTAASEKGVIYVQSEQWKHGHSGVFVVNLNIFLTFSTAPIDDFNDLMFSYIFISTKIFPNHSCITPFHSIVNITHQRIFYSHNSGIIVL